MSTLTYLSGSTSFINSLSSVELVAVGGNPLLIEMRDLSTNALRGAIEISLKLNGNIGGLTVTDGSGHDMITLTGSNASPDPLNALLSGSPGTDEIYTALVSILDDNTSVVGSGGADSYIETGAGNDTVSAGGGNDVIRKWAGGNLVVDGGTGIDRLEFSTQTGITFPNFPSQGAVVNLTTGEGLTPFGGTLALSGIEQVAGSFLADTFTGNGKANVFGDGLFDGGADTIRAGLGNDTVNLSPSSENASVNGGGGEDTLVIVIQGNTLLDLADQAENAGALAGVKVAGFEVFRVSEALASGQFTYTFRGSSAGETVYGSLEGFTLPGEEHLFGKDTLRGRGGNDTLNGLTGDDKVLGEAGSDRLFGGGGRDVLSGGLGNDTMTGGKGVDTFVFDAKISALTNVDVVTDFNTAADRIRLDTAAFDGLATGHLAAAAFHKGAAAADATDRIIYNASTGELFFDTDGKGGTAQVKFAILDSGLDLTAGNFFVV